MTYDPTIPNANHFLSVDQPLMQTNFAQANVAFTVDHTALTDNGPNQGRHKKVTLLDFGGNPAAGPGGTFFAKAGTDAAINPFFIAANGQVLEWIKTAPNSTTAAASGSASLPGGIMVKWGTGVASSGAGTSVFYFGGGFTTAVWSVIISMNGSSGAAPEVPPSVFLSANTNNGTTLNQFLAISSGANANIYYIAIGK